MTSQTALSRRHAIAFHDHWAGRDRFTARERLSPEDRTHIDRLMFAILASNGTRWNENGRIIGFSDYFDVLLQPNLNEPITGLTSDPGEMWAAMLWNGATPDMRSLALRYVWSYMEAT